MNQLSSSTHIQEIKHDRSWSDRASVQEGNLHWGPQTYLESCKDGWITCGYDGRIIRWSRDSTPVWSTQLENLINQVQVSGAFVFAATAMRSCVVLDLESGQELTRIAEDRDDLNVVTVSFDGVQIATAGESGTIHLYQREGWQNLPWKAKSRENCVNALRFITYQGQLSLLIGDDEGFLEIINLQGECLLSIELEESIEAADVGEDFAVIGLESGRVLCLDTSSGSWVVFAQFKSAVKAISIRADGAVLLGSYDGTIAYYRSPSKFVWKRQLDEGLTWARDICFDTEELNQFAVTSSGSSIQLFSINTGERLSHTAEPTLGVNVVDSCGERLWVGGDNAELVARSLQSGEVLCAYPFQSMVISLAASSTGILAGGFHGELILIEPRSLEVIARHKEDSPLNAVAWSSEGTLSSAGTYNGELILMDLALRERWRVSLDAAVKGISFIDQDRSIVAALSDGSIALYSLDGDLIWIRKNLVLVNGIDYSEQRREFATVGRDQILRIWDISGRLLRSSPGHDRSVKCVRYSPDGKWLATTGYDGILWIWDAETLSPQAHRQIHEAPGTSMLAWRGQHLFSGGWDLRCHSWLIKED